MAEPEIFQLVVEFEEVDGVRKIKPLPDGTNPIEAYAHTLIEIDREYRKEHNDWPLIDHSVCKVKSMRGEPEHYEITVYSLESGKPTPISRVVIVDKATGKPAPIIDKSGKYTPKAASAFHIGQVLTHEKLKEAAVKRGLQIKSEQLPKMSKIIEELEG